MCDLSIDTRGDKPKYFIMSKRKRIKTVKTQLVASSNEKKGKLLVKANKSGVNMPVKSRKDSLNLGELPDSIKLGVNFDWK